jgi:transposase
MGFVAVESAELQASGMAIKTRDLLVRQRTQTINALLGHMAECGVVAPNGPVHFERLAMALANRAARIAWALMTKGGVYQAPNAVRA